MHTGIDYAAPTGTPIKAAADGEVIFKGWKGGYGNTVMIRHANGVETLYGHMSAFSPADGRVRAGEVIGLSVQPAVLPVRTCTTKHASTASRSTRLPSPCRRRN